MRRFSQRNSLVTLSDINITPLLDLAFVLLIIFVITTPLLEQGMALNLPTGGGANQIVDRQNVHTVEVSPQGVYMMDSQRLPLAQIEARLAQIHRANPRLVVYIRVDDNGLNKHTYAIIDGCLRNGITQFSLRTQPLR